MTGGRSLQPALRDMMGAMGVPGFLRGMVSGQARKYTFSGVRPRRASVACHAPTSSRRRTRSSTRSRFSSAKGPSLLSRREADDLRRDGLRVRCRRALPRVRQRGAKARRSEGQPGRLRGAHQRQVLEMTSPAKPGAGPLRRSSSDEIPAPRCRARWACHTSSVAQDGNRRSRRADTAHRGFGHCDLCQAVRGRHQERC